MNNALSLKASALFLESKCSEFLKTAKLSAQEKAAYERHLRSLPGHADELVRLLGPSNELIYRVVGELMGDALAVGALLAYSGEGREIVMKLQAGAARARKSAAAEDRKKSLCRAIREECPAPVNSTEFAARIRPAICRRLDSDAAQSWPSVSTIRRAIEAILKGCQTI